MSGLIWRLPGPQSFVRRVTEYLDSGTSVILQCPPNTPGGLSEAIRDLCCEDYRHLQWTGIDASELDFTNASTIAHGVSLYGIGEHVCVSSVDELATQGRQRVYAIENIGANDWVRFSAFIQRFRSANHQLNETDRDVFLVRAKAFFEMPNFDVGLRVMPWQTVVREIDSRLLLEMIFFDSNFFDLESIIRVSVATELGGADLRLVEKLSVETLDSLLSPIPFLRNFANSCNWCSANCSSWLDGGVEYFRNRPRQHSAVAALANNESEIRKRIWHGQLAAIFPYLEERRLAILPRLQPFLKGIELKDAHGNCIEMEDLELGSLFHFIRVSRAPAPFRDEVGLLRSLRHELAHLRPIQASLMSRFLRYANKLAT